MIGEIGGSTLWFGPPPACIIMRPSLTMKPLRVACIFLLLMLLAGAFRFPDLAQRPMHCDEAVHAVKFGTLLENGRYEYDPVDYHGPTLNYLTLPSAWFWGDDHYVDVDETVLRLLPAISGVLLAVACALLIPVVGTGAAAAAGLLTAISPVMVFYSRYYIHETLLVFFSFGALILLSRYMEHPRAAFAVGAGLCLGLAHATKETSILVFASLFAAFLLSRLYEARRNGPEAHRARTGKVRHLWMGAAAALLVSALFFSSFLSHTRGVIDSWAAFLNYFELAGAGSIHSHPWHYYFQLLLYFRLDGGPVWSEGLIIGLAVLGMVAGFGSGPMTESYGKGLRFLGFYTIVLALLYSMIPYKTPWCLLGLHHGMILLAGAGTVFLLSTLRRPAAKGVVALLLLVAAANLGLQAWSASFRYETDPGNPWVYAHTGKDIYEMVNRIEALARSHPEGLAMPVQIISRENLWPLPWYLRRFTGIGWWNGVPDAAPNAPLIIATPDMEPELLRKLYEVPPPGERELYMNAFDRPLELRPQVELRGYASKTLWDEYREK